jgi:DNA-binding transcriptional MerR regulator
MAGIMSVHDLHPSPGDADDLYRIGTVASLTGIAVERLRAWERRYDFTPAHRDGKTRYYSGAQLARLKKLKALSDAGHPISSIVELGDAQLDERLGSQRQPRTASEGALKTGLIGPNLLVLEQQSAPSVLQVCARWANMAAFSEDQSATGAFDCLIVQLPVLLERHVVQAQKLAAGSAVVAVYQFATPAELAAVEERGVPTLSWPAGWPALEAAAQAAVLARPGSSNAPGRQFSDEALIAIAASVDEPSGCAQHLVALITQLNALAEYSDEYAASDAEDPATYERIQDDVSLARAQLEGALRLLLGEEDDRG